MLELGDLPDAGVILFGLGVGVGGRRRVVMAVTVMVVTVMAMAVVSMTVGMAVSVAFGREAEFAGFAVHGDSAKLGFDFAIAQYAKQLRMDAHLR